MKKAIITWFILSFFVLFFALILTFSDMVSVTFNGVAVDSKKHLYVGKDDKIEIYENGELLKMLKTKTDKVYYFTVQSDDTILISNGMMVYIIDFDENILDSYKDVNSRTYSKLKNSKDVFTASDGTNYYRKSHFGKNIIVDSKDNQLYETPAFDYSIKLTVLIVFISWIILIPITIIKYGKEFYNKLDNRSFDDFWGTKSVFDFHHK